MKIKFKKILKTLGVIIGIGIIINMLSNCGSKNVKKKNNNNNYNHSSVTTYDSVKDEPIIVDDEVTKKETKDTVKEDKEKTEKKELLSKRSELENKYFYVGDPIVRNNKKYFPVRQKGFSGYGWVDCETLVEVIPPNKYDTIGSEVIIAGKSYVYVSVAYDDDYAYGLLSLDTFKEVVPCKTYRVVDIENESVECLQTDRVTIDVYEPNGTTKILSKK